MKIGTSKLYSFPKPTDYGGTTYEYFWQSLNFAKKPITQFIGQMALIKDTSPLSCILPNVHKFYLKMYLRELALLADSSSHMRC